jgi:hypothetical protein
VLLTISELPKSSGRFVTGGDSHGQYRATGCPDGALHQRCVPSGQATVFHAVSPAQWLLLREVLSP